MLAAFDRNNQLAIRRFPSEVSSPPDEPSDPPVAVVTAPRNDSKFMFCLWPLHAMTL